MMSVNRENNNTRYNRIDMRKRSNVGEEKQKQRENLLTYLKIK